MSGWLPVALLWAASLVELGDSAAVTAQESGVQLMTVSGIRNVPDRLAYYAEHGAPRANQCAFAVREALNAPWQGLASATAVWRAVPLWHRRKTHAPRGAIVYWTGGSAGYGHTCFALGNHMEISVDVLDGRAGAAGVVPFSWFAENWPRLDYAGWSWWWGGVDTREVRVELDSGATTNL